jgi:hypothetical protein
MIESTLLEKSSASAHHDITPIWDRPASWDTAAVHCCRRDCRIFVKSRCAGQSGPNHMCTWTTQRSTPLKVMGSPNGARAPVHMQTVLLELVWEAAPHSEAQLAAASIINCSPPLEDARKAGSSAWTMDGIRNRATRSIAIAAEASRVDDCARSVTDGNEPRPVIRPARAAAKLLSGAPWPDHLQASLQRARDQSGRDLASCPQAFPCPYGIRNRATRSIAIAAEASRVDDCARSVTDGNVKKNQRNYKHAHMKHVIPIWNVCNQTKSNEINKKPIIQSNTKSFRINP